VTAAASPFPPAPFVVAHRAGNDLVRLRAAHAAGIPMVEADVWLFRRRPEVRHLKTIGPIPILWDRWYLANPFAPRLLLPHLLGALGPGQHLMLDLKGRNRRLVDHVLHAMRHLPPGAVLTVCSRTWSLLAPFRSATAVAAVHSVGSARQLRAIHARYAGQRLDGVSIDDRLLDRETVRALNTLTDVVLAWPVASLERARRLVDWGVSGLITERLELASELDAVASPNR
jgi:glycerophosphoryl diester phosphodiesterase